MLKLGDFCIQDGALVKMTSKGEGEAIDLFTGTHYEHWNILFDNCSFTTMDFLKLELEEWNYLNKDNDNKYENSQIRLVNEALEWKINQL